MFEFDDSIEDVFALDFKSVQLGTVLIPCPEGQLVDSPEYLGDGIWVVQVGVYNPANSYTDLHAV
jgi:hypothetical protein